jgi:DNA invertase Pin-like site-specific DNA recombinase
MHPGPVDGLFGPRTKRAVERVQRAAGLPVTGVAGTPTRRALAHPASSGTTRTGTPSDRTPHTLGLPRGGIAARPAEAGPVHPELLILIAAVALLLGALVGMVVFGRLSTIADGSDILRRKPDQRPEPGDSEPVRAIGYVSTPEEPTEDLIGPLRAQAREIGRLCEQRGWQLVDVVHDVEGAGGRGLERPGLLNTLERIGRGEASCLVVSQVGRLARSVSDLGRILEWLSAAGGRLVAMDVSLDTMSADGQIAARTLVSVGATERRHRAERTRKGLEAARARGLARGRATIQDFPALKERIAEMRAAGLTLQDIADELNAEGVPTMRGGAKWRPSSVQTAAGYRRPSRSRMPRLGDEGGDE